MSKVVPNPSLVIEVHEVTSKVDKPVKKDDDCSICDCLAVCLVVINVIIVIAGFISNRPTLENRLHEACMWESGHYQKFHCGDIGKSECVDLKTIYPNSDLDPFQYIIEDNPQDLHEGPIEWKLGDVSICICLDGYNVHSGSCQPSLIKWYDPNFIFNLLSSIALLLPISNTKKTYGPCYLIITILLLVWGIEIVNDIQLEYSRYNC